MSKSSSYPPRYRRNQSVQWIVLCLTPQNDYSCKGWVETVIGMGELLVRRSDGAGFRVRWVKGIGLVAGRGLVRGKKEGEDNHECFSAVA